MQTIGYLVVLAGFVMAFLMHHAGGAAHEELSAPEDGAAVPAAGDGGMSGDPLAGRRRRLLHEAHEDPARSRVAELHGFVGYVVFGMITLQVGRSFYASELALKVDSKAGRVPTLMVPRGCDVRLCCMVRASTRSGVATSDAQPAPYAVLCAVPAYV